MATKTKKRRNILWYENVQIGFEWICRKCKMNNLESGWDIHDMNVGQKIKCSHCKATHIFKA
jgi:hypothetical protein